jgi:general secretion pathway protein B
MSFILDALKKAEAERQRQTGPTLLEVRVAQPRRRFPTWTIVIGALLVINILLLIVFELRRPAPSGEPSVSARPAAPAPVTAAPTAPTAAAPAAAASIAAPPAALAPAAAPATTAPSIPPDAADQSGDNPADFEPAVSPSGSSASAANSSTQRARPPSLSDIGGDVPDLRLDLHVYAVRPADRYALINMHRVHEGDVLPEGARVVAIDRDGVELIYHGTNFMLHPQ